MYSSRPTWQHPYYPPTSNITEVMTLKDLFIQTSTKLSETIYKEGTKDNSLSSEEVQTLTTLAVELQKLHFSILKLLPEQTNTSVPNVAIQRSGIDDGFYYKLGVDPVPTDYVATCSAED